MTNTRPGGNIPLTISALIWVYWGILHLWVAFEGIHQYISAAARTACGTC